jgi:hypothetical protein
MINHAGVPKFGAVAVSAAVNVRRSLQVLSL